MPSFSVIVQDPAIRAIVQDGILEREFKDALFPHLLFRSEVKDELVPNQVGDTIIKTGKSLITPDQTPIVPGGDAGTATVQYEQWSATIQKYGKAIDTDMPTSAAAAAKLFLSNSQQIGMHGAQSLNRKVRNVMYNAALSGWTVADGGGSAITSTTSLRVKRLNGFTKARRPDLSTGSAVKFDTVSTNNPLKVSFVDNGSVVANTVVGFTADNPGDEFGPGVLTLGTTVTSVADRAYIKADDATAIVRSGGGNSVDALSSSDLLTLADVRTALARLRTQNVPTMPDMRYHAHFDPVSESQAFSDPEFQRLNRSLPDYYMYKDFAMGELLGCVFLRDSECPLPETVNGGLSASYLTTDPFGGELWTNGSTSTGIKVHRAIFVGQELLHEYYTELGDLVTEAGVTGKVAKPQITNNGIEVMSDRIMLILRAPLDRLQDKVSTAWKFIGDWAVRTDVTSGDVARYKRTVVIESGE